MNLKTHTAYAEIDISPHNIFTVKIISGKGEVLFEDMGAGKDQKEARTKANNIVHFESSKYEIEE